MIKSKTSLASGETIAKILAITSNNNVYEALPSDGCYNSSKDGYNL